MRLAILSDIHANAQALDAVLQAFQKEGVDEYLCAGDLVGYGPDPDECVEKVGELGATTVAGNHDLITLGELATDRCIPLARNSLHWTREHIKPGTRRALAALPRQHARQGLHLAHGSWEDPQEYVTKPEQAAQQLTRLAETAGEQALLILGHTHRRSLRGADGQPLPVHSGEPLPLPEGPVLLNPGSIGQSRERDPRASAALLDLEKRTVTFLSLPYNHRQCREALRRHGLPTGSCHLAPHPLSPLLRPFRATLKLLRSR